MSHRVTTRVRPLLLLGRVVAWLIVPLYITGIFTTFWLERRLGLRDAPWRTSCCS